MGYGKQNHMDTMPQLPGVSARPILVLSPIIAEGISKGGYSRTDLKKHLWDHARRSAWEFEKLIMYKNGLESGPTLCERVEKGELPKVYCESTDSDRKAPLTCSPDDILIVVSGDPDRNRYNLYDQNAIHGWPVSKKIKLPPDWEGLLKKAEAEREARLNGLQVIKPK